MLLVAIFLAVASAQPLSISSLNPFRGVADVADATLRGAAAITGAAADATLNAGAIAADATLNAGAIAADATLKAGAVAADATLKGADAVLRGAAGLTGAAADATLKAGAIAADATLKGADAVLRGAAGLTGVAADATLKGADAVLRGAAGLTGVAADATLKGADAVLRGAAGLAGAAVPVAANILYREPVPIVKYITESNPLSGKYSYSFEAGNGIVLSQAGEQKVFGDKPEEAGAISRGSYSFPGENGVTFTVNWYADETGFHATGDHLPVAPPMPAHVVKLLADLAEAGVL